MFDKHAHQSLSIQKYIAAQVSTEFMSLINVRCLQPTNSDLTFLKVKNSLAETFFGKETFISLCVAYLCQNSSLVGFAD